METKKSSTLLILVLITFIMFLGLTAVIAAFVLQPDLPTSYISKIRKSEFFENTIILAVVSLTAILSGFILYKLSIFTKMRALIKTTNLSNTLNNKN